MYSENIFKKYKEAFNQISVNYVTHDNTKQYEQY